MGELRLRSIVARGTEAMLSVVLVLVCFMIFLALLTFTFPKGTRLTDLIRGGASQSLEGAEGRDVDLDMGNFGNREVVAMLSDAHRTVKHKPVGTVAWTDTEPGLPLHHRHAVQTFDASKATISFDEGNVLELGENSLIVVKSMLKAEEESRRRRSLIILGGELRGRISAGREDSLQVEVVAGNGESRIRPSSRGSGSAVCTAADGKDESTTLSVHEGEAQVTAGDRAILVKSNQAVVVTKDQSVSRPAPLPDPPTLVSPEDGFTDAFRRKPPPIRFAWSGSNDVGEFRIAIARDPAFRDVVYEADVDALEIVYRNLDAGDYFWRVRGMRDDALGNASVTHQLALTRDDRPPQLDVLFPQGVVAAPALVMKGVTDPGTAIFIAGRPVEVGEDGWFEHALELERGANVVVVEAVDESGNTTYRSQVIHAKY
jgi:hypothetical protein